MFERRQAQVIPAVRTRLVSAGGFVEILACRRSDCFFCKCFNAYFYVRIFPFLCRNTDDPFLVAIISLVALQQGRDHRAIVFNWCDVAGLVSAAALMKKSVKGLTLQRCKFYVSTIWVAF